jgi:hypothetical protein
MKPDTATKKGLLTGIVMILISVGIYFTMGNFQNNLQYITYTVYVAGIIWTLLTYSKQPDAQHKFGAYFSQGFKCFIVVALLMVIFTAVFLISQPHLKQEMATIYEGELAKVGNYTKPEIQEKVAMAKKSFVPAMLMAAIFGYLVIGAMVTAIGAAFLSNKNKMQPG